MDGLKGCTVEVKWLDSFGVQSGWQDISGYNTDKLVITSWGKVIYENNDIISLAHNYAEETQDTVEQANGVMTIPKACIISITSVSCGQELALKR